jgi:hypothetical protein
MADNRVMRPTRIDVAKTISATPMKGAVKAGAVMLAFVKRSVPRPFTRNF